VQARGAGVMADGLRDYLCLRRMAGKTPAHIARTGTHIQHREMLLRMHQDSDSHSPDRQNPITPASARDHATLTACASPVQ
jgi:hypothetical protein